MGSINKCEAQKRGTNAPSTMTPMALPSPKSSGFQESLNAYTRVVLAESRANSEEKLRFARVVGYLLLQFYYRQSTFGSRPLEQLIDEVMSKPQCGGAGGYDFIYKLGESYQNDLLRGCAFCYFPILFTILVFLKLGGQTNHMTHLPRPLQALPTVRSQRRSRR